MKAVVFHGIGDIRLDDVREPKIEEPTDAVVRITASAICGTDLHIVRGTMPGMKPGTILGHEGGRRDRGGRQGRAQLQGRRPRGGALDDRCGYCSYCRAGYHVAVRQRATRTGPHAGTPFFGGPATGRRASTACRPSTRACRSPHVGLVQAARRRQRRPGDPALGHLPDRLLRRRARRDQAGRHGGGVRLRAGRASSRSSARKLHGRGARLRGRLRRRRGWRWRATRARRRSTSTARIRSRRSSAADRRHRRRPRDRRGRRGRRWRRARAGSEAGEDSTRRVPARS